MAGRQLSAQQKSNARAAADVMSTSRALDRHPDVPKKSFIQKLYGEPTTKSGVVEGWDAPVREVPTFERDSFTTRGMGGFTGGAQRYDMAVDPTWSSDTAVNVPAVSFPSQAPSLGDVSFVNTPPTAASNLGSVVDMPPPETPYWAGEKFPDPTDFMSRLSAGFKTESGNPLVAIGEVYDLEGKTIDALGGVEPPYGNMAYLREDTAKAYAELKRRFADEFKGKQLKLASAYRNRAHNAAVPKSDEDSPHMEGDALDISFEGLSGKEKKWLKAAGKKLGLEFDPYKNSRHFNFIRPAIEEVKEERAQIDRYGRHWDYTGAPTPAEWLEALGREEFDKEYNAGNITEDDYNEALGLREGVLDAILPVEAEAADVGMIEAVDAAEEEVPDPRFDRFRPGQDLGMVDPGQAYPGSVRFGAPGPVTPGDPAVDPYWAGEKFPPSTYLGSERQVAATAAAQQMLEEREMREAMEGYGARTPAPVASALGATDYPFQTGPNVVGYGPGGLGDIPPPAVTAALMGDSAAPVLPMAEEPFPEASLWEQINRGNTYQKATQIEAERGMEPRGYDRRLPPRAQVPVAADEFAEPVGARVSEPLIEYPTGIHRPTPLYQTPIQGMAGDAQVAEDEWARNYWQQERFPDMPYWAREQFPDLTAKDRAMMTQYPVPTGQDDPTGAAYGGAFETGSSDAVIAGMIEDAKKSGRSLDRRFAGMGEGPSGDIGRVPWDQPPAPTPETIERVEIYASEAADELRESLRAEGSEKAIALADQMEIEQRVGAGLGFDKSAFYFPEDVEDDVQVVPPNLALELAQQPGREFHRVDDTGRPIDYPREAGMDFAPPVDPSLWDRITGGVADAFNWRPDATVMGDLPYTDTMIEGQGPAVEEPRVQVAGGAAAPQPLVAGTQVEPAPTAPPEDYPREAGMDAAPPEAPSPLMAGAEEVVEPPALEEAETVEDWTAALYGLPPGVPQFPVVPQAGTPELTKMGFYAKDYRQSDLVNPPSEMIRNAFPWARDLPTDVLERAARDGEFFRSLMDMYGRPEGGGSWTDPARAATAQAEAPAPQVAGGDTGVPPELAAQIASIAEAPVEAAVSDTAVQDAQAMSEARASLIDFISKLNFFQKIAMRGAGIDLDKFSGTFNRDDVEALYQFLLQNKDKFEPEEWSQVEAVYEILG